MFSSQRKTALERESWLLIIMFLVLSRVCASCDKRTFKKSKNYLNILGVKDESLRIKINNVIFD